MKEGENPIIQILIFKINFIVTTKGGKPRKNCFNLIQDFFNWIVNKELELYYYFLFNFLHEA